MNTINVENCKTLLIGRRGENEVTTVAFDFTEWASEFGSGVVDLYVKRFGDDSAYPVVLTIDGTIATWTVTATDTNVAGYGKAEYVYRVDGKIAKSAVFPFFVAEDIGQPASEPPDPYESWLEQLTALGAETEAHAQAAEQSAEDAAESAEDAAQSAASAEGYAGQAETAAGLAQAAQTASEAARDAAQTAQASAEASATAASGSAASAAGSATAAAGSAYDASASATAAGDSATAASASATTASNAATAAQAAQSAAEDAAEDAQEAAQQAHVEYEQLSGEVDDLSDEVSQQKSAIEDLTALVDRKAGMLVDTASGAIASFIPDATIPNLLGVTVDIEPVQDTSGGDPSPTHICPISGWDSVELKRTGANLVDEEAIFGTLPGWTVSDGVYSGYLAPVHTAYYENGVPGLTFKPETQYTVSVTYSSASSANGLVALFFYTDGTRNSIICNSTTPTTFTLTSIIGKTIDKLSLGYGANVLAKVSNFQLVEGTSAPAFKPYAGSTYTITLGQTVYGGTLDVTNGTLTVDMAIVDLGTLTWSLQADNRFQAFNAILAKPSGSYDVPVNCFCSAYATRTQNQVYRNVTGVAIHGLNGKTIYVYDPAYDNAATFKAAMSGVQLCYELDTSIEIQLDPVTIAAIANQTNNVWADAGNVEVEFAADLKTYIDSKIAAAVAALS